MLNTPDDLYTELGPDGFWNEYNKPFLDAAIERGYEYVDGKMILKEVN